MGTSGKIAMAGANILELKGISKSFGGVKALDNVDFELRKSEIHGLVGENGAGKSTLMKILSGVHTHYGGEFHLQGKKVHFASPRSSMSHGIGMVYQELSNIAPLSVAENLFLFDHPRTRGGFVSWKTIYELARAYLEESGIGVDARSLLEELPFGMQQLVEIARVVHSGADILILDEPTSALSPAEVASLFELMRNLKERNKSVVFISHFIDDVLEICDRVTILKNGRNVGTFDNEDLTKHFVIQQMLGDAAKDLAESYESDLDIHSDKASPVIAEIKNAGKSASFHDISFSLHEGEILGIYGAMGAGHAQVGECLFGLDAFDVGKIFLEGKPLSSLSPTTAKAKGVAYVASDRATSLFLESEVYKNVSAAFLRKLLSFPLKKRAEVRIAEEMIARLNVKTPSSETFLQNLSGGNQQKVAIARWLVHPIRLLILNEPTRGMDVGAKEEVMRIVKELKKQKVAVLLISSEPETIIANSDRILVMCKGRITEEFANQRVSKDMLMRCA
ncbi:sugar ABC transporter ATP-binding protein [Candidatus Hydrogenedentota bacterium]